MHYERPMYSAAVITPKGTKYVIKKYSVNKSDESNLVTSMNLTEPKGQLAQKATITMANIYIEGHGYPSHIFPVKSRVFIYAEGGGKSKSEEVFRGFIWDTNLKWGANGNECTITCYDNLIYFMNSEICEYFSKGKGTKTIVSTLCKKWGISVKYNYDSITHPKLPLSGTLADVLTSELLDAVKKRKSKKYVIRSKKDVMYIDEVGKNDPVYKIERGEEGIMLEWSRATTMENMVTKVVITGNTDDNGKTKVVTTVKKNTKEYGTLQKVISKSEDTKLSEIKSEANTMLKEGAQPFIEYEVSCLDIPWIRKGDKVSIEFNKGVMTACIVQEVTHNCDDSTMNLIVEALKNNTKK